MFESVAQVTSCESSGRIRRFKDFKEVLRVGGLFRKADCVLVDEGATAGNWAISNRQVDRVG